MFESTITLTGNDDDVDAFLDELQSVHQDLSALIYQAMFDTGRALDKRPPGAVEALVGPRLVVDERSRLGPVPAYADRVSITIVVVSPRPLPLEAISLATLYQFSGTATFVHTTSGYTVHLTMPGSDWI